MDTRTFELNAQDVQIIMAALDELPYKISANVINKMQSQMTAQKEE